MQNGSVPVFYAFGIEINLVAFFEFIKALHIVGIQDCHTSIQYDGISLFSP